MGTIHVLTSFWLFAAFAYGAEPATKHKRGEGLIPKSPSASTPPSAKGPVKVGTAVRPASGRSLSSATPPVTAPAHTAPLQAESPSSPCLQPPSLEKLFRTVEDYRPEPAFGGVYFLRLLEDTFQVHYQTGPSKPPVVLTNLSMGIDAIKASPDGKSFAALSPTESGGRSLYLWLGSNKPFEPIPVPATAVVNSVAWSADGKWLAFTSNHRNGQDFDLYRYNLTTKAVTPLATLSGFYEVKDIAPNGKSLALAHYLSWHLGESLVWTEGQSKAIQRVPLRIDPKEHAAAFSADSKGLFVIGDGPQGRSQLHFLTLGSRVPMKALTQERGVVERFRLDPSRRRLVYTANNEGESSFGGWEVGAQGTLGNRLVVPRPQGVFPDGASPMVDPQPGQSKFFFVRTSTNQPRRLMFWNGRQEEAWSPESFPANSSGCFARVSRVTYPSYDKTPIPAFLFLPAQATPPLNFVVFVHEGPDQQFRPGFHPRIQYLTERGFGVIAPNIRGSTGYGRPFQEADDYKKRDAIARDLVYAAVYLVNRKLAVPGQITGIARGPGAWLLAKAMQMNSHAFTASATERGSWELGAWMQNLPPFSRRLWEAEFGPSSDKAHQASLSFPPERRANLTILELDALGTDLQSPEDLASIRHAVQFFETRLEEKKKGSVTGALSR